MVSGGMSAIGFKLNSPNEITGFGYRRRRIHAGSYRLTGGKIKQGYTLPEAIKHCIIL